MKSGKTLLVGLIAVFAGVFSWCGPAAAKSAAVGGGLRAVLMSAAPIEEVPIIVRMSDQVRVQSLAVTARTRNATRRSQRAALIEALRRRAQVSQNSLREMLRVAGKTAPTNLWLINGLALKADPSLIAAISSFPGVASVTLDGVVHLPEATPSAVADPPAWNLTAVHAPDLWAKGITGQGVVVAILDTGVDLRDTDLASKWRGGSDSWFDPYSTPPTTQPYDVPDPSSSLASFGHGTAVMGVLVGGSASGTAIGVAPGAKWIAAKIFDDSGNATLAKIHQAFQWALDPDSDPNTDDAPDVVNNSWGLDQVDQCYTDNSINDFQPDIRTLKAAGIAVVFAAGNDGPASATSESPANYPESVAVGAVDRSNLVASFSSRGPSACGTGVYPTLAAPGVHIETTGLNNTIVVADGTSFSAPHVAGVMALLLSQGAFPNASVTSLESALRGTAADLGSSGPDSDYGYGLIDALAAYSALAGGTSATPALSLSDSTLSFGNVPVDANATKSLTLSNVGGAALTIQGISGSGTQDPFSIASDTCSGNALQAGDSCSFSVQFSPIQHQSYNASLQIATDLASDNPAVVAVSGAGNSAPTAASLTAPANGATGLSIPVTLSWDAATDPDNDPVTESVRLSTSSTFGQYTTLPVTASTAGRLILSAGMGGGILLLGLWGGVRRRGKIALILVFAIAVFVTLSSCGGGGGGGTAPPPPQGNTSLILQNLNPATTYYWKVISKDSFGATTESAARSFTTQ